MSEWKEYQLSELSDIVMGQSPPSNAYNEKNIGFPFLQGCAEFGDDYPTPRIYCSDPKKLAPANSILISVRAPVGLINKSDKEYIIGRGLAAIVPTKGDFEFLYYQLNQIKHKLDRVSQGSTFLAINSNDLNYLLIDAPISKDTQRKIARILSSADAVIEKTQAAIAKYKAIKQGMLHDLFTRGIDPATNKLRPIYEDAPHFYKQSKLGRIPREWEVERLGEVGEFKNGVNKDKTAFGYGTLFVNIIDAYPESLDCSTLGRVNININEKHDYELTKGDIIFVRSSVKPEGVGYNTLFIDFSETIVFCGFMIRYRFNNKKDYKPEFFNSYFRFDDFRRRLIASSTVSANTNINQVALSKLLAIKPTENEQIEIIKRLEAIDIKIQTEQAYLKKLQQIKAGLMADLLSGKKSVIVDEEPSN